MSLDAQETELLKVAARDGIEVVATLRESKSAKAPGRPLFTEMLGKLSNGDAEVILCWKLDRLARNPVDGGTISWLLQQNQVKAIITHERTYLPSDNVLLMSVEFGMSNQYIRDLSVNVKRGLREKLRRGEWPGKAHYGYKNDKNTHTSVVVPSEAKKVVRVYELYNTGNYTFSQISKELGLQKSLVERILRKKFYHGIMESNGAEYPGTHTPLITKETYDLAQQIKSGVTVKKARPQKIFFPYRGLMHCAECGCMLTATVKKGRYEYYYCTNGKGHCPQHLSYLNDEKATELVTAAVDRLHYDEEIIEMMYQAACERHEKGTYSLQTTIDSLSHQLRESRERERKLLHSFTAGLISEDLYTEEAKKLVEEKKVIENKLRNYTSNSDASVSTLELTKEVFLSCNRTVSEFKTASPARRSEIAKNLLWNFTVKDKKALEYKYKSPYEVIANAPKSGDLASLLAVWDDVRTILMSLY